MPFDEPLHRAEIVGKLGDVLVALHQIRKMCRKPWPNSGGTLDRIGELRRVRRGQGDDRAGERGAQSLGGTDGNRGVRIEEHPGFSIGAPDHLDRLVVVEAGRGEHTVDVLGSLIGLDRQPSAAFGSAGAARR